RKEQHEQTIILERDLLHASGMHVDQKRDLLERDEGYAQRQNDAQQDQIRAENVIDGAIEKVDVFEVTEERDVEGDAQQQNNPGRELSLLFLADSEQILGGDIVDNYGRRDDEHIERPPPGVERERRQNEPAQRPIARHRTEQEERSHRDRQKCKQKLVRIEQHRRPYSRGSRATYFASLAVSATMAPTF